MTRLIKLTDADSYTRRGGSNQHGRVTNDQSREESVGGMMADTDISGQCYCDWDDYDPPRVYNEKIRTARKEHTCYECGETIGRGRKYEDVSGLSCDGDWFSFKTHLSCAGIRRDFCCNVHGSVAETFADTYGFSPWTVPKGDQ